MLRRLLLAALLVCAAGQARAAELLMITTAGCPFCARWEREVGPIYPRTAEGRRIPLRRAELRGFTEDLVLQAPLLYTPTFVLLDGRREVGRITGYSDDAAFWGLLGRLIATLDSPAPSPVRSPP